jgi:hypothetical protein
MNDTSKEWLDELYEQGTIDRTEREHLRGASFNTVESFSTYLQGSDHSGNMCKICKDVAGKLGMAIRTTKQPDLAESENDDEDDES